MFKRKQFKNDKELIRQCLQGMLDNIDTYELSKGEHYRMRKNLTGLTLSVPLWANVHSMQFDLLKMHDLMNDLRTMPELDAQLSELKEFYGKYRK